MGTPGLELARPDLKAGRSWGSRAPFRILADHAQDRKPADWRLWGEWPLVAEGRRTLEWSRGLRAQVLPDERERTDEELAEEIAALEAEVWTEVVRHGLNVAVLAAVEAQALGGLVVVLRGAGRDVMAAREGWLLSGGHDRPGLGAASSWSAAAGRTSTNGAGAASTSWAGIRAARTTARR